jgi:hypothetical protein
MKPRVTSDASKLEEAGPAEQGYDQWKLAKIQKALAEADKREKLIPAEQVWRDLDLER